MVKPLIPDNRGRERWGTAVYETFHAWIDTAREVGALMNRVPEPYHLYPEQLAFLLWLGEFDGVDPGQLSLSELPSAANLGARADLGEGTVAELLVKLVILELVESRRTAADESFDPPLYSLTDAARALLDEVVHAR